MSCNKNSQYAFYSTTQENNGKNTKHKDSDDRRRKNVRYNIYELLSGKEVMVTEVNNDINYAKTCNFNDMVYQGEIKRWVRVVYW